MKWLFKKAILLTVLFVCVLVAHVSSVEMIDTLNEFEMEPPLHYAATLSDYTATTNPQPETEKIIGIVTAICTAVGIVARTVEKILERRRCRREERKRELAIEKED